MFEQVISGQTRKCLAVLGENKTLDSAYLAGGTALALRIGHRVSVDLDFFTRKEFDARFLTQKLKKIPVDFSLDRIEENTLLGFLRKTKFSLFFFDYPLLDKTEKYLGINIASLRDIAAMKVSAISQRGAKRDFIDLYYILVVKKLFSLQEILGFYNKKFNQSPDKNAHIIRSLTYFVDAESANVPRMFFSVKWKEIKKFFEKEASRLMKDLITK